MRHPPSRNRRSGSPVCSTCTPGTTSPSRSSLGPSPISRITKAHPTQTNTLTDSPCKSPPQTPNTTNTNPSGLQKRVDLEASELSNSHGAHPRDFVSVCGKVGRRVSLEDFRAFVQTLEVEWRRRNLQPPFWYERCDVYRVVNWIQDVDLERNSFEDEPYPSDWFDWSKQGFSRYRFAASNSSRRSHRPHTGHGTVRTPSDYTFRYEPSFAARRNADRHVIMAPIEESIRREEKKAGTGSWSICGMRFSGGHGGETWFDSLLTFLRLRPRVSRHY